MRLILVAVALICLGAEAAEVQPVQQIGDAIVIPMVEQVQPIGAGVGIPVVEPVNPERVASPFWSFCAGPVIEAENAADWENTLGLFDQPNTDVIADAVEVSKLKITHVIYGFKPVAPAVLQDYLLAEKAKGYNAVLLEWRTGSDPGPVCALMSWARLNFDTVIVAPVPSQRGGLFPSVSSAAAALTNLMGQADAVLLGWGFTIDEVFYGDPAVENFCALFFRWCENQAALAGVPVWGNVYVNIHGGGGRYQYTPTNLTAYVCGNIFDYRQKFVVAPKSMIARRLAAEGVPAEKPVILGPFYDDRIAASYSRMGYGVLKMRTRVP